MASVLEYLQDLFFVLFSRNPQEAEKRRALRKLTDRLRQMQPPVYRRSGGMLLPAFGYSLLQLSYLLAPLGELFQKTLYGEDARLAERFRQHLAVARLPETLARRLPEFALQAMRQRTLASASPIKELDKLEQEFEQLLEAFSAPQFYSFDLDFMALDRLASLCRHDLGPLFKLFEPGFDPAQKGRKPSFQPVQAKKALKELLDLYFILAGIHLSEGVETNLLALLERLGRSPAGQGPVEQSPLGQSPVEPAPAPVRERSGAAREQVRTVLGRLGKLLERELAPDLLATLIRVIQEDPDSNPRVVSEELACLQGIKADLAAGFRRDQERLQREINENTIGGDLKTLFGGADPLEVTGYTEALSAQLAARGYDSFARVRPLAILKSFILGHFEKNLRDPLKRLLVEGTFATKMIDLRFNNTFYACEGLGARLRELEESLVGGSLGADKLGKFLQMHDQGKPAAPLVAKTVETIEHEVRKLVEEGCNYFYNLNLLVGDLLEDAKQKAPALITNLKEIAGRPNKDFLAGIAAGHLYLQLFIKIMRNFTEIRENPAAAGSRA
jgi:hypothetical protein